MRTPVILAFTTIAVVAIIAAALLVGPTFIAPENVISAFAYPWHETMDAKIVRDIRLPRVCIGAVVGSTLGVSGALLQTLARNPLADPFIIGVSAGAGLAIAIGVALGVAQAILPVLGFVSGLAATVIVIFLALRAGTLESGRLILSGLFVSSFLAAFVTIILTRLESIGAANEIQFWLAGTLSGRSWPELLWSLPYAIVGFIIAAIAMPSLNMLRLGEQRAATLGTPVIMTQWLVIIAATLLTSTAVTLSGLVGFVGLLVPHMARRIVGTDVRKVAPLSAVLGVGLVLSADIAARTLSQPGELPIGALLSIVGVPTFFVIAMRDKTKSLV